MTSKLISDDGIVVLWLAVVVMLLIWGAVSIYVGVEEGAAYQEQICQSHGMWVTNDLLRGNCIDINGEHHSFSKVPWQTCGGSAECAGMK